MLRRTKVGEYEIDSVIYPEDTVDYRNEASEDKWKRMDSMKIVEIPSHE